MIELDVQIAKALGYTYQREDGHYYRLYDPHGLLQATVDSRVGSVWHALIREGQEIGNVPRWSRDGGGHAHPDCQQELHPHHEDVD